MISAEVNQPLTSIRHKKKGFTAMVYLKNVDDFFSLFLREKRLLDGEKAATIRIYSKAWFALRRHEGEIMAPIPEAADNLLALIAPMFCGA